MCEWVCVLSNFSISFSVLLLYERIRFQNQVRKWLAGAFKLIAHGFKFKIVETKRSETRNKEKGNEKEAEEGAESERGRQRRENEWHTHTIWQQIWDFSLQMYCSPHHAGICFSCQTVCVRSREKIRTKKWKLEGKLKTFGVNGFSQRQHVKKQKRQLHNQQWYERKTDPFNGKINKTNKGKTAAKCTRCEYNYY